jgi:hypothetical protein
MANNIPMEPVKSSQIAAVGHDPDTNTLAVQFKSGGTYHYANVTPEQFDGLRGADSVGSHFHQTIRHNEAHPFRSADDEQKEGG